MIWIIASIFAACFQTIRTAIQKHLKADLSTNAINWVRYSFGLPFVILYMLFLTIVGKSHITEISIVFLLFSLGAAISQIIATGLLLSLFGKRNFAVGTTYAKTESLQTAFLGLLLFSETITLWGWIAIIIGMVGIMLISLVEGRVTFRSLIKALFGKTARIGFMSGAAFSFSGLFIRQATLTLNGSFMINAGFTLLVVMIMQFVLLGGWILYTNKQCFSDIIKKWKACLAVGLTSALGSIGWFTAFALTNAAYVKTIGQVELLFSILVTHKIFKEHISKTEILGMLLVVGSIILLVFSID